MEAALVAGLTGVGMEPVDRGGGGAQLPAAHLLAARSCPGWLSFHYLERRDFI